MPGSRRSDSLPNAATGKTSHGHFTQCSHQRLSGQQFVKLGNSYEEVSH